MALEKFPAVRSVVKHGFAHGTEGRLEVTAFEMDSQVGVLTKGHVSAGSVEELVEFAERAGQHSGGRGRGRGFAW